MTAPGASGHDRSASQGWIARLVASHAVLAAGVGLIGGIGIAFIGARISPLLGLAGVLGAGATAFFLRFPVLALYALAFAVPVERFGRISDDTSTFTLSITRGIGVLAMMALVPVLVMHRRRPFVNGALLLWTVFTGICLLTLTYTSDLIPGVRVAAGYVGNILFLFTVMNLVRGDTVEETRHRAHITIIWWLVASTAVALYSIYDWHLGSGRTGGIPVTDINPQAGAQLAEYRWSTVWMDSAEEMTLGGLSIRRSMGSTSHAAVFGINLIMSIPFYFYVICRERGRALAALMWVGLAASLYCVLLTNTRATLAVAIGVMGLCVLFRLVRITSAMIMGGIVLVLVAPFALPEDIFDRVLDWKNYSTTRSAAMQIRLDYWVAGRHAIADHWLLGNGMGNQRVVLDYLRNPIEGKSHMHNIYLQTLMDVGVVGWAVFLAFLGVVVRSSVRAMRIFRAIGDRPSHEFMSAAVVLIIGVLVYGLQVDVFYFPLKAWWLVLGLVFVMSHHAEQAAKSIQSPPRNTDDHATAHA